jgi:mono/diheme cytochrome c family protein
MLRPAALALVVVCGAIALGATLAGCGSAGRPSEPDGKALFARSCSGCHSLGGINSPRQQGGDLLGGHFSRAVMLQFASEMPVPKPLSQAELERVADYVVSVERAGR